MSTADLTSRLKKIQGNVQAKQVNQQKTMVVSKDVSTGKKPGPKCTWKDESAKYVRLFTQIQESDRNLLKSTVNGGVLTDTFETVDHFINEAVVRLMKEYGLEPNQHSTVN